jgi:transposase
MRHGNRGHFSLNGECVISKNRVFSREFKERVAQRILNGESVSAIHNEILVKRSVLYRWRDAFRKEGAAGLQRPVGRPPGIPNPPRPTSNPEEASARRISELERKIGQQALENDFLRRAFKRVKESRRNNDGSGATASTERSES